MSKHQYQHDYDPQLRRAPLLVMAMLVILIGTTVGAGCGWLANQKLNNDDWVLSGMVFGMVSGWMAGLVWSRMVLRQIFRSHRPHKDLRAVGTRWGTIVGLAAAFVVFVWLILNLLDRNPNIIFRFRVLTWLLISELFGGLVGAIVGYLCGWMAYLAAKIALPLPPLSPKHHPQRPI